MPENCTTCGRKVKHHGFDTDRGDFWRCTAEPVFPAFDGSFPRRFDAPLVNLRSFDSDHPSHEYQLSKSCPLWEAARA